MTGQRKLVLMRKKSQQGLSLGSKLVKALEGLLIQAFSTLNFITLMVRLSLSPQKQGMHLSHR